MIDRNGMNVCLQTVSYEKDVMGYVGGVIRGEGGFLGSKRHLRFEV